MRKRLTTDMAAIICILADRNHKADNFVRTALAALASDGMVDIVGGQASITAYGLAHYQQADHIMIRHVAAERRKLAAESLSVPSSVVSCSGATR